MKRTRKVAVKSDELPLAQQLREEAMEKLQHARALVNKVLFEFAGNEPGLLLELSADFMERAIARIRAMQNAEKRRSVKHRRLTTRSKRT